MATRARSAQRAKGEGSIYFNARHDRWEATIELPPGPDGRRRRAKVTGRTKKEAADRLRQLRRNVDAGASTPNQRITVSQFLARWLEDVLPGSVSEGTLTNYGDVVRLYVTPHVGGIRLSALTPAHVKRWLQTLAAEGKSPRTQQLARAVLRRALRWAQQEGLVARNVAAIADGPKQPRREGRTLTPDQARALLEAARDHRLSAAFMVSVALGLRRGELLGLQWDDVRLDDGRPTLTIRRQLVRRKSRGLVLGDTKTVGSVRAVVVPGPLVAVLREHKRRQAAERLRVGDVWSKEWPGLVFTTEIGTPVDPDNWRRLVYSITTTALGERWSPHELRHTAASVLLGMGVPLKVVSELLGHSSIRETADTYSHLLLPAKDEAAAAMAAALWT